MATPTNAYTLTFNFGLRRISTQEDIAEFTLWMETIGGAEYGDTQLGHAAHGGYKAWQDHQRLANWANNVFLNSVTARAYLSNGHTLHEQDYAPGTLWQGSGSGPALPWETSLCVSLYTYQRGTFVSNGRRKRGRYYLPPMQASRLDSSNSGYYSNSEISDELAAQHDFLQAAQNDELGVQIGTLSVFSRADGVLRHVSNVSMDAKFDSQRRRENREQAAYLQVAF